MAIKVGINGFGRIGRQVTKALFERYRGEFDLVAVNDLSNVATNAHLFKYDSNYGAYPGTVEVKDGDLVIDGDRVRVLTEKDPSKLPWGDMGVDIVVESTGIFTSREKAELHLHAGAKKVIISAPAKGEDLTIVMGVNEEKYDPAKHNILSNASCTTNCLAPAAKVLNDLAGIKQALMTTVHAYTNDQRILDLVHSDLRRARAAAINIVPASTGAAKAIGLVLPELNGKLSGSSYRVPVPTGSIVDLTAIVEKSITKEELFAAYDAAAAGPMKGILFVSRDPLVSIDFKGSAYSSSVDYEFTNVYGNMVKIVTWYDNEWGYSSRVADLMDFIAKKGL